MSAAPFDAVLSAPFGALGVRVCGARKALAEVVFLEPGTPALAPSNPLTALAIAQLERYLHDPRHRFDLPLAPRGTAFQQRVWREITAIAPGSTRTYGEIAARLGSAARAVGQACGSNPLPVVVPCHRVLAASSLGGFAHARSGWLLDIKRWLLAHEARACHEASACREASAWHEARA